MPLTDQSEVVANYLYEMMIAHQTALSLASVWYGDQDLQPQTPAVCVAPGDKVREFQGASYRTLNTFETYMLIYYAKIQDVQQNLHAVTVLADSVETVVHSDLTLGGNVISVLCTRNEPGLINKGGALVMGARLTFTSQSKTTFPPQV